MKKTYFIIFTIIIATIIYIGSNIYISLKPVYISYEFALDSLYKCSPINSAHFYKRYYKDNPFLTKLFIDSIVPYFVYSSYKEIKNINFILSKTPLEKFIHPIYQEVKDEKYKEIVTDLDNYRNQYEELLVDSILPLIIIESDDIVEKSIDNIFDDYAGGFMNYKKLGFFLGRDSKDFVKCWNKESEDFCKKFNTLSNTYIESYLSTIDMIRDDYFREWIPYFDSNVSRFDRVFYYKFEVPKKRLEYVNQYTDKETNEMIYDTTVDLLIEAGTIAAGTVIGGPIGAFLTSTYGGIAIGVGTGIYQSLNKLDQLDSDDKFKYAFTEFALEDIEQFFIKQTKILKLRIKTDDEILLKTIKKNL